jgi:uncharacterized protein YuzE
MEIRFTKHALEKFAQDVNHNMQTNNFQVSYDRDADVLSRELSQEGKIDYASEMGNVVVHFTKENKPVYLEVLNASKFLQKSKEATKQAEDLILRDKSK